MTRSSVCRGHQNTGSSVQIDMINGSFSINVIDRNCKTYENRLAYRSHRPRDDILHHLRDAERSEVSCSQIVASDGNDVQALVERLLVW